MRKSKFSLVLSSLAFMLLFGVMSAQAQGLDANGPAASNFSPMDVSNYDVSGTNFVTASEAYAILKTEVDNLLAQDPSTMTEAEEAQHGVRLSYYPHLGSLILAQNDVSTALPSSAAKLIQLVDGHKAGLGLDPQAIYQETVSLFTN